METKQLQQTENQEDNNQLSLRDSFRKAIEAKDLSYAEMKLDLRELSGDAELLIKEGPKNEVEFEERRKWIARKRKVQSCAKEVRMTASRFLDKFKESLIAEEKELFLELDEDEITISAQNNKYISDKIAKEKAENDRLEKEKNKAIEKAKIITRIETLTGLALKEQVSKTRSNFNLSWGGLTLADFDTRITMMKGYKPKLSFDALLKYFDIAYVEHTPDEFEGILRATIDFNKFSEEFSKEVEVIKNEFLLKVDEKKKELETQSAEDSIQLKKQIEQEEIEKKAKELLEKQQAEDKIRQKEADIIINAEIEKQAKLQGLGHKVIKNITKKRVAKINGTVDWNTVINIYISEHGEDKLEFLLTNLVKQGCPEVKGIKYEIENNIVNK